MSVDVGSIANLLSAVGQANEQAAEMLAVCDDLIEALERAAFRCICFKHGVQCAGCQEDAALIARIRESG